MGKEKIAHHEMPFLINGTRATTAPASDGFTYWIVEELGPNKHAAAAHVVVADLFGYEPCWFAGYATNIGCRAELYSAL